MEEYLEGRNVVKMITALLIVGLLFYIGATYDWSLTNGHNVAGTLMNKIKIFEEPTLTVSFIVLMLVLIAAFVLTIYYEVDNGEPIYSNFKEPLPLITIIVFLGVCLVCNVLQSLVLDTEKFAYAGMGMLAAVGYLLFLGVDYALDNI